MITPRTSVQLATISIAWVVIPNFIVYFAAWLLFYPALAYIMYFPMIAILPAVMAFVKGIKDKDKTGIYLSILVLMLIVSDRSFWSLLRLLVN